MDACSIDSRSINVSTRPHVMHLAENSLENLIKLINSSSHHVKNKTRSLFFWHSIVIKIFPFINLNLRNCDILLILNDL